MLGVKILSMTPIVIATLVTSQVNAETSPTLPFIEYGALGLAGMVVWFLQKHLTKITDQHEVERKQMQEVLQKRNDVIVELVKGNVSAFKEMVGVLKSRPCLIDDTRLDKENGT